MHFLQVAYDFLASSAVGNVVSGFLAIGGLDLVMRLIKTDKPASVLLMVQGIFKAVIKVLGKLDDLIDAIVPQRLKGPGA